MIENLQSASQDSAPLPQQGRDEDQDPSDGGESDRATSSNSSASGTDEGHSMDPHPTSSTPPRAHSAASHTPFPSGNRQAGDETIVTASDSQRSRTTSASAAQGRVSSKDPTSKRERHKSSANAPGSGASDREILKGKGGAPPSSWSRPRPQALALRSGRANSITSASLDSDPASGDIDGEESGSPAPQAKRYRQTSQPVSSTPEMGSDSFSSPQGVPRSVSSGYVFPRATSPGMGDDSWYADQEQRWERGSEVGATSARSPVARSFSPGLESPITGGGGYQAFGALSPTSPRAGVSRSTSHNDDFWATQQYQAGVDELQSLQRRYDNLARVLQEKERNFESTQSLHETTIADLETKVEGLEDRNHTLTKSSDEMKQKEQRYLDEISRLEGDLSVSVKRCEGLERTRDVMTEDLNRREQTITGLQGKINELQERISSAELDEAEHFRHQHDWEQDRDQYREELDSLRRQVGEAHEELAKMKELESEREALQSQLRQLHADLEEARRNSGFLQVNPRGSTFLPTSLSKVLGAELDSVFGSTASRLPEHQEEEEEEVNDDPEQDRADPDESGESIIVTTTRRRRKRQDGSLPVSTDSQSLVDTSTQTEKGSSLETELTRPLTEGLPPTYDEAAMEQAVVARLHPASKGGLAEADTIDRRSVAAGFSALLGLTDQLTEDAQDLQAEYDSVVDGTEIRCRVMEDAIKERKSRSRQHRRRRASARNWQRLLSYLSAEQQQPANTGNLLFCGLTTMALGVLLGSILSGSNGKTYYHHWPSGVMEDGLSWQMSNTLSSYGLHDYGMRGTANDGMMGSLLRIVLGSARTVAAGLGGGGGAVGGDAVMYNSGVPT